MSITDDLLANNERYAESFHGPLPLLPSAHLAVVACMDARMNVSSPSSASRTARRTSSVTPAAWSPTTRSGR